ncbi:MAG: 1-acyl-sn-glycerol-3-phosphate acyltransferase [Cyclobacteriaceae bacterium]
MIDNSDHSLLDVLPNLFHEGGLDKVVFNQGYFLNRQFARVEYLFVLIKGEVSYFLENEEFNLEPVGKACAPGIPIGWSALNIPFRHSSTAQVSSSNAEFYCIAISSIHKLMEDQVNGNLLMKAMCRSGAKFFPELVKSLFGEQESSPIKKDHSFKVTHPKALRVEILRQSPFFEIFDDEVIERIASLVKVRTYEAGATVLSNTLDESTFLILEDGWVDFYFGDKLLRSISTSGFVISWVGIFGVKSPIIGRARQKSNIYSISRRGLDALFEEVSFSVAFHRRLLWLLNVQLVSFRTRHLVLRNDSEKLIIKGLIARSAGTIPLNSKIHMVSKLLSHPLSQQIAFDILHELHSSGNGEEQHLASLCLDNMTEMEKESLFYQGLVETYHSVFKAENTPEENQIICAKSFIRACNHVDYEIEGWENLPAEGGHIFIYNHLKNHPHNTLPNDFQVTLDSHFISSLILYKKYGQPGKRVVRIGRGIEYGHQNYYERLGHINVITPESGVENMGKDEKKLAREEFYNRAKSLLSQGDNLIISPEGTSFETENSPGKFKTGAFRLAMAMGSKVTVVPVVMANFDRRVRNNVFRSKILPPIKIEDHIRHDHYEEDLKLFTANARLMIKNELAELGK